MVGRPGRLAGVLDAVAGLVGELAEIDLVGVGGARQHADIGAGAEHARLARAQQYDLHLRVLEAQPLDRVGQLDVDAEVVGIELELVAFEQRALLVDVHQQGGDLAVDLELPVAILRRLGLEIDPALAVVQLALCIGHRFLTAFNHSASRSRMFPTSAAYSDRTRAGPSSVCAARSPSWWSRSSRLANSEITRRVASGASRYGAWRVSGNSATSTGQ